MINQSKTFKGLFYILVIFFSQNILSNIDNYFAIEPSPSASNYGNTGLLELPTARFMKEGSLRFNFSASYPYEYTSLTASPFNWFEATYRYNEIKNQKYGPSSYSGNQTLKDKGFDLKIGIIDESFTLPSVAFGIRDLAGTGLFSSEYFVASKRIKDFDFTMGLGWGLLGSEGGFANPFSNIDKQFDDRIKEGGQGGSFSYKSWFSGQTSLFGGLEYSLKKHGLRFKLEYDTSNPDANEIVNKVDSRFNIGVNYAVSNSLKLAASFERGNQFRVAFTLKGVFTEDTIRKPSPKNVLRLNNEQLKASSENKDIFFRSLNKSLRDEAIYIQAANYSEDEVDLSIATTKYFSLTRASGRAARVVSALTPESVTRINIRAMNGDFEVSTISINRKEFDLAENYKSSPMEVLMKSNLSSSSNKPLFKDSDYQPSIAFPEFEWNMSPSIRHQIGGPEGFYLGQLLWKTDTSIKFRRNLVLYTSIGLNIYDTFEGLSNPSGSSIPHVRSDIQEYLDEGKNHLQRMQLEYFSSPYKDLFVRLDAGILEEMFGGVGGEVLYRPFNKNWALGLSVHRVRQRDFDQRFSFRQYKTNTGHLGFYYDLPYGISSQLLIGKYLAGDKGATLDLSRRFKSGFTMGVFATKTDLSAEEFGEGSFDKGFYISIPTKLFYSDYRSGNISFGLHPLTKDGGALMTQHNSLYSILGDSNANSIQRDWSFFFK